MRYKVYLADVEDPALWDTTEQVLVIFLDDTSAPPQRLVNPEIVGLRPAEGLWWLLFWDHESRRAYYQRISPVNT